MQQEGQVAPAVIRLGGYPRVPAHLVITRYPGWLFAGRIIGRAVGWLGLSWRTLILTFNPFVASFPFVIGLGWIWRAIRERYDVHAFAGACPRCEGEYDLPPGSKINLPYDLVRYRCHHESELRLEVIGAGGVSGLEQADRRGVGTGAPPFRRVARAGCSSSRLCCAAEA